MKLVHVHVLANENSRSKNIVAKSIFAALAHISEQSMKLKQAFEILIVMRNVSSAINGFRFGLVLLATGLSQRSADQMSAKYQQGSTNGVTQKTSSHVPGHMIKFQSIVQKWHCWHESLIALMGQMAKVVSVNIIQSVWLR